MCNSYNFITLLDHRAKTYFTILMTSFHAIQQFLLFLRQGYILENKGKLFPNIMRDSRHFNCEPFLKIIHNSRHLKNNKKTILTDVRLSSTSYASVQRYCSQGIVSGIQGKRCKF